MLEIPGNPAWRILKHANYSFEQLERHPHFPVQRCDTGAAYYNMLDSDSEYINKIMNYVSLVLLSSSPFVLNHFSSLVSKKSTTSL